MKSSKTVGTFPLPYLLTHVDVRSLSLDLRESFIRNLDRLGIAPTMS